jgi:hypothetical protein
VIAAGQTDVINELVTPFDAVNGRIRFAPEIGVARDIYPDLITPWKVGEAKMKVAFRSRDWLKPVREPAF